MDVGQDWDKYCAVLKMAMTFQVPKNGKDFSGSKKCKEFAD
jgi:hypothetical protein